MSSSPYNFVFIGRSGCGKGTQADLLRKELEQKSGTGSVFYINTGSHFRNLVDHSEFLTARLLNEKILQAGEKAPDALAIWACTEELIHGVAETNHLIIDGSPRTALEAQVLEEMFGFFGRTNVFHIWLNASDAWVYDRMMERGRFDDKPENIKNRLAYYEKFVVPAIEFYKNDSKHTFIEINGEQPVENVHRDIVKAIGL